ncbi:MAG: hypothetical protein EOP93_14315 [Lysobacteraceae bacterium]|nr:MAG: hypothetical protein EOP93_14315 [Xanthomonadaceae bacterium]
MPRRFRPLPTLLATALMAALPTVSAWAQQAPPRENPRPPADRGAAERPDRRSLSDSVRAAERDTRGEVLSAERVQYDGRDMHRVKVVDDSGRVRVFMQDPQRRDSRNGRDGDARPRGGNGRGNEQRPSTRDDDD